MHQDSSAELSFGTPISDLIVQLPLLADPEHAQPRGMRRSAFAPGQGLRRRLLYWRADHQSGPRRFLVRRWTSVALVLRIECVP